MADSSTHIGLPCSQLGKLYPPTAEGWTQLCGVSKTLLWFSYRKGMPTPTFPSDAGWGCTLRSMQMLLSNALLQHALAVLPAHDRAAVVASIARTFVDWPRRPGGLPRVVASGGHTRWYGPHEAAHAFVRAQRESEVAAPLGAPSLQALQVAVLACRDAALYIDEVHASARAGAAITDAGEHWLRPVLAIVPLRLGLKSVNPAYIPSLLAATRLPAFAGAVGGTPRHSLYFTGAAPHSVAKSATTRPAAWAHNLAALTGLSSGMVAADVLLYMDPHTTQTCPPPPAEDAAARDDAPPANSSPDMLPLPANAAVYTLRMQDAPAGRVPLPEWDAYVKSLTPATDAPRTMSPSALDPTISLSFMFRSAKELKEFQQQLAVVTATLAATSDGVHALPLFDVQAHAPEYDADNDGADDEAEEEEEAGEGSSDGFSNDVRSRGGGTGGASSVTTQLPAPPLSSATRGASNVSAHSSDGDDRNSDGDGLSPSSRVPSSASSSASTPWYMPVGLRDLLVSMWWNADQAAAAAAAASSEGSNGLSPHDTDPAALAEAYASAAVLVSMPTPVVGDPMDASMVNVPSPPLRAQDGSASTTSHAASSSNRTEELTEVVWDAAADSSPEFRPVDPSTLQRAQSGMLAPPVMDSTFSLVGSGSSGAL